ncbi:MAG TPA: hypothetical protein VGN63_09730 [Flavisolibacter sp.]|jgi:hypothetical protein|nr:hypothetical protein [Flavisolibacter sp.]
MNKTTLQFQSLVQLAAFMESMELMNFEINYNALTLNCELEQEAIDKAMHVYQATVIEQEVLD